MKQHGTQTMDWLLSFSSVHNFFTLHVNFMPQTRVLPTLENPLTAHLSFSAPFLPTARFHVFLAKLFYNECSYLAKVL